MNEGLKYLKSQCQSCQSMHGENKVQLLSKISKAVIIPIYSFINQMVQSLKQYLKDNSGHIWADFVTRDKRPYFSLQNITTSWCQHLKNSLECQLLSTLLLVEDHNKLKTYVRIRKLILMCTNGKMLDEIALRHEDVIIHRLISSEVIRREIIKDLQRLFVSFKITDAKIYSCVLVQYLLSIYDNFSAQEKSLLVKDTKSHCSGLSDISSLGNFNSNIHQENGLYRKLASHPNAKTYKIIDAKFIPKKYNKQNTQNRSQQSYYYSNSLSDQSSDSKLFQFSMTKEKNLSMSKEKTLSMLKEKPLSMSNEKTPILSKQKTIKQNGQSSLFGSNSSQSSQYCCESNYTWIKKPKQCSHSNKLLVEKIVIEEQDENMNDESERSKGKPINRNLFHSKEESICDLAERNKQFKEKMLKKGSELSSQQSSQLQASHNFDSIHETINIIHHSIVHHAKIT